MFWAFVIITGQLHKTIVVPLKCETSKIWLRLGSLFMAFQHSWHEWSSTKYIWTVCHSRTILVLFCLSSLESILESRVLKLGQKLCIYCQRCEITFESLSPVTSFIYWHMCSATSTCLDRNITNWSRSHHSPVISFIFREKIFVVPQHMCNINPIQSWYLVRPLRPAVA